MRQQQAQTDYLRFKDAARDKVLLMQELLRVWHAAIPPQLLQLLQARSPAPRPSAAATTAILSMPSTSLYSSLVRCRHAP